MVALFRVTIAMVQSKVARKATYYTFTLLTSAGTNEGSFFGRAEDFGSGLEGVGYPGVVEGLHVAF